MYRHTDDIMLYIENPKEMTHTHENLLQLINEFDKVARCKINIQKSVALYTLTTNYQKED